MFPQFSCLTSHFSRSSRLQLRNAPCKLRFQLANTSHLLPHIHKLALEHGLHFGTGVILCRNASSSLTSLSENPNSWVCRTNSRSRIRPPSNKRYPPALRPAVLSQAAPQHDFAMDPTYGPLSACASSPGGLTINDISESDPTPLHSVFRAIVISVERKAFILRGEI